MNESIDQFVERVTAYTEKATPGFWYQNCTPPGPHGAKCYSETVDASYSNETYDPVTVCVRPAKLYVDQKTSFANMVFIAHSRTDLPTALVHIAALQARVAELEARPCGHPGPFAVCPICTKANGGKG